ncbi:MAG TPA: Uma2 family endonuclease [Gemmataceae bacterium]|nr:Uma2 family endonuclease [Gemmataceae bacterium]
MSAVVKTIPPVRRQSPAPPSDEQAAEHIPLLYRFSVEQYEKMLETAVLSSADRVELIEGIVVQKMTQHPPHAVAIDYTMDALRSLLPEGWRLREQKPIKLSDSEPEPDLIIVRGPLQRYETRHPRPADIAVVIEVADTSLEGDRGDKGRMYARARISVYWIINLNERQIEVYTEPKGGKSPAYRRRTDYGMDTRVPLVMEGREVNSVSVSDFLPSTAPRLSS